MFTKTLLFETCNISQPDINTHILLTVDHIFSYGPTWENLLKNQDMSSSVIISSVLITCILKPRLHERFFACASNVIFSNFVASLAQDENRTCSHDR